jgi:hypothetical protein
VPAARPPAPARLASTGAALDGKAGVETPKARRAHHATKKRVARHPTTRKTHAARHPVKAKPAPRKAVKHATPTASAGVRA